MDSIQKCRGTIRNCGVELGDGSLPVLHTPSTLFRYQLSEAIRGDSDLAGLIGDFLDELLADHDAISLYLDSMTLAQPESDNDEPGARAQMASLGLPQTDSLVRLMLGVDELQPRLISTLLDKFPEYIGDEGSSDDLGATKVSVKILRQLRWLDYVINSAALTEKLLETLGFVPPDMQREIISALPDIISDSDNTEVSKVLAGMLSETPELMLPILETLGSLSCSPSLLQEARNSVIMHLVSAEPTDLPVMLRFLLQSVSAEAAAPTILRIRKRLDLDSIVLASRQLSKSADDQSPDVLIFDAIATSLRSHKHLRDAWLKLIAADMDEVGSRTTLDIVVLLIVHQITTHTKRVETVLKAKIDAVSSRPIAYTPTLIESTIARFPAVFSVHFAALLSVASWLIQNSALGSQGARVASTMVVAAFGAMGLFQRQEISGELAVHIGSGNENEVDTATHIYLELARRHPYELRPFAVFIKGLLDYVDNLSIGHVRTIFDTLGILSTLSNGGQEDSMFNDLYIFVRKQLSSVYPKYNRIGVVGTVSLLRQLGSECSAESAPTAAEGSSTATQAPRANIQALRRAVQLLEMLMDSGRHQSWTFISMTYDELAHIVETKGLHPQLLTWLHENVSSTFATQFLSDAEDLGHRYLLTGPPAVALSLDEDEAAILDVFNHNSDAAAFGLHSATKRADAGTSADGESIPKLRGCILSCLPSLLRLIQVCEKALGDGSLNDMDALLVCGIYMLAPIDVASQSAQPSTPEQSPSFALADSDDLSGNASLVISGNALVGVDEDSRSDLITSICRWPLEVRRTLCMSLYVSVNWIREIINAFADQAAEESRRNVILRINQLSQIESDLESLAVSLGGTANEFHPVAAGLIPEISDAPVARTAVGGAALRIQAPSTQGNNIAEESGGLRAEQSMFMVDVGGLLLSQEDTRKLVDGNPDSLPGEITAAVTGKKRGRKRKSAGMGQAVVVPDDFARNLRPFLRELSFSAFNILKLDGLNGSGPGGGSHHGHGSLLSASGLFIILRELHMVVCSKLIRRVEKRVPWAKHSAPSSPDALATFSSNISSSLASEVFARLLALFPSLLRYLDSCLVARARYCNDVNVPEHAASQGHRLVTIDALTDVAVVERCIDLLLQIISSALYWDGLQADSGRQRGQRTLLSCILGALARQGQHTDESELDELETHVLARRAFDYLQEVSQLVATSSRAIDILRMLVAVRSFVPTCERPEEVQFMSSGQRNNTMDGKVSSFARHVLDANWRATEDLKPADLEYLVTQHIIRCPGNRLELISDFATHTLPQSLDGTSMDEDIPATLRKPTFPTYYKAVSQALATVAHDTRLSELTGTELLQHIGLIVDSWKELAQITQRLDYTLQRAVLIQTLRSGFTMLDLFARAIVPRLDACFFAHRDEVIAMLARMQKSTRILQSICNHSKASKDTKLQSVVPQTKRKLEQLIFQVYRLMENNDCLGAIELGTLKHRDVQGRPISSQIPVDQQSSEEEESELPDDVSMESENEASDDAQQAPVRQYARRGGRGASRGGIMSKATKRTFVLERRQLLQRRRNASSK